MSERFADAIETRMGELKRLISEHSEPKDALTSFKDSIDREISDSPNSSSGIFARYIRARACEDGVFDVQDVDAILNDYSYIMSNGGDFRAEGTVGYARLLYGKSEHTNAAEALSLCIEAIHLDSNPRAMMLAGYIHDHTLHDLESAASWYLRAFKNKLPWGLRFYASVQFRRKKYAISILAHIATTIVSPFLVLRYGKSDPFRL